MPNKAGYIASMLAIAGAIIWVLQFVAGADKKVIINNYTIQQVQSNIVTIAADRGDELMASYPLGSVLFGMADRKIVYEAKPRLVRMDTDTDLVVEVNEQEGRVGVQINHLKLSEANDEKKWNQFGPMLVTLSYKEGKPVQLPIKQRFRDRLASFWVEILDKQKGIFVLGLRDAGPLAAP